MSPCVSDRGGVIWREHSDFSLCRPFTLKPIKHYRNQGTLKSDAHSWERSAWRRSGQGPTGHWEYREFSEVGRYRSGPVPKWAGRTIHFLVLLLYPPLYSCNLFSCWLSSNSVFWVKSFSKTRGFQVIYMLTLI